MMFDTLLASYKAHGKNYSSPELNLVICIIQLQMVIDVLSFAPRNVLASQILAHQILFSCSGEHTLGTSLFGHYLNSLFSQQMNHSQTARRVFQ